MAGNLKSIIRNESDDSLNAELSRELIKKKSKTRSKSSLSVVIVAPGDLEEATVDAESTKTLASEPEPIPEEESPEVPIRPRTPREFIDDVDRSTHPSYTNFKLPYEVVCRLRYQRAIKEYNKQFRRELEKLETMQPSAYEALRFNRLFSITTLWPPLHTRKEIENVLRNFYKIPRKQQTRLNNLLRDEQH